MALSAVLLVAFELGGPPTAAAQSTGSSYPSVVNADAPSGYWRLAESSGTAATDQTGNHPGVYENGPSLGQPGAINGSPNTAVGFDGTNDQLRVPNAAGLNSPSAFSIEAWMKPAQLPSYTATIARKSGQYLLRLRYDGALELRVTKGGSDNRQRRTAKGLVNTGDWYHVVVTYDGSELTIWVNGVASGSLSIAAPLDTSSNALIFASSGGYDWFNGTLDELAVYDTALSPERIAAHFDRAYEVDTNDPPIADAGSDQSVASQASGVSLDAGGSTDPDNDPLDYSWTQTAGPAVTLSGASTQTPSFDAPVGPATLSFELEACDQEPLCDTDTVVVAVDAPVAANQAPIADAGSDQSVASQASGVSLDAGGSTDPDNDPLDYSWTQTAGPAVTLSGASTQTPSFDAPVGPATLSFELEACDQEPLCDTDTVVVAVDAPVAANQAPIADAGSDQSVASQASGVSLDAGGSTDPDNDPLDYSWTQTAGPAVTLSGASTQTPSFDAPVGPATLSFELEACDQEPLCDTDTVVVAVDAPVAANQAPIADAGSDQSVASQASGVSLDAGGSTDPDNDPLDYSWTQTAGPAVTLSGASTQTPSFDAPVGPATLSFELEACDQEPLCDTDTVVVAVDAPGDTTPPETTIDSGPSGTTADNDPSFAFSSSESGSSFECKLDSGSWSSCSSPKDYADLPDGDHSFEVRATDGAGNTDQSPASSSWTIDTTPPQTTSYSDEVSADAPSGYWRLAESSGTAATDQTGNHPGVYENGPSLGQPGAINGSPNTAVGFDGTNDQLRVPNAAGLNSPSAFSIEAWMKPAQLPSYTATIARKSGQYLLRLRYDGALQLRVTKNGSDTELRTAKGLVAASPDTWYHVVVTYDGSELTIWVNGVASGSLSIAAPLDTSSNALIFASSGGYDWFNGTLDELAVYDTALSPERIAAHFDRAYEVDTNDPPIADAGSDQSVASQASGVSLDAGGSTDPDNDPLDYSWTQTAGPAVTLSGASTQTPSFDAPVGPATLSFELEACDQEPLCDTDTVVVAVDAPVAANQAPIADAGSDQSVASQASGVSLDAGGSTDPDNDPLDYSWTQTAGPAVTLSGASTQTPSFDAPVGPATLSFELEACDQEPLCDTDTVVVAVDAPVAANQAPIADAGSDQSVASQASGVSLDAGGSTDPDNDPLDYSWTQTAGPAVTLSGASTQTPSFDAPVGPATLSFELEACDQEPLCDTDTVVVAVDAPVAANQAPIADAGSDQSVASQASGVSLDAGGSTDPDNDPLDYSWTQTAGPAVTLSGASTQTPSFDAPVGPATLSFELEACDQEPLCDTDTVVVAVDAPGDTTPPETTIDSGPSGTTADNDPSFAFSSSESGSSFECKLDSGSWSSCSSPKDYADLPDGDHSFEVRATDGAGNTDQSPASSSWTIDTTPPQTTSYSDEVSADAPSGYWRLAESSGTAATDQTGNHPGVYENGPSLGQPGAINGSPNTAVGFDGTNDQLRVPNAAGLNSPSAFSIEAWMKPAQLPSYTATIARKSGQYLLRLRYDGALQLRVTKNGSDTELRTAKGLVAASPDTWYHVVVTYDGSELTIWVNGVASGSLSIAAPLDTSSNALIFASSGGYDWFNGTLDELAVYDTALSPERIAAHFDRAYEVDDRAPAVSLKTPTAGSTMEAATNFGGKAGTTPGDRSDIKVRIWEGADAGGTLARVLNAVRRSSGTFSVLADPRLPSGTYTARAEQLDDAGNLGLSDEVTFGVDADAAPSLLAAGDVAYCGNNGAEATAQLLDGLGGSVAMLGDAAYEAGTPAEFDNCYDPNLGPSSRSYPSDSGRPRLRHAERGRLLQLLRCKCGRPNQGLLQL